MFLHVADVGQILKPISDVLVEGIPTTSGAADLGQRPLRFLWACPQEISILCSHIAVISGYLSKSSLPCCIGPIRTISKRPNRPLECHGLQTDGMSHSWLERSPAVYLVHIELVQVLYDASPKL